MLVGKDLFKACVAGVNVIAGLYLQQTAENHPARFVARTTRIIAVADRDAPTVFTRDSLDLTVAADLAVLAVSVFTAADTCAVFLTLGVDVGIENLDRAAVAVLAAADTCRVGAAVGFDGGIRDGDTAAVGIVAPSGK